jgi:hypothetical protein
VQEQQWQERDCILARLPRFLPLVRARLNYSYLERMVSDTINSVTSVGATIGIAPEVAVDIPGIGFYSGGGFSNYVSLYLLHKECWLLELDAYLVLYHSSLALGIRSPR